MRRAEWVALAVGFALAVLSVAVLAQPGSPPAAPSAVAPAASQAQAQPQPPGRWTLEQIREAFARADTDGNAQLTRAEAQHLAIMPRSFEDTDENKDGVIVLREYEASFRQ